MTAIEWCRDQQLQALEHMQNGHTCGQQQCTPTNVRRWLTDAFAEELELMEMKADV